MPEYEVKHYVVTQCSVRVWADSKHDAIRIIDIDDDSGESSLQWTESTDYTQIIDTSITEITAG